MLSEEGEPGTCFPCRPLLSRYAAVINGSIGDHKNLIIHSDQANGLPNCTVDKKKKKSRCDKDPFQTENKMQLQMFCSAPQTSQVNPLPGRREFAAAEREA